MNVRGRPLILLKKPAALSGTTDNLASILLIHVRALHPRDGANFIWQSLDRHFLL
ncbi:hypothetical protein IV61_GL002280 [Levilactobacillus parabrevis]|nr:hypothetical protein IV61_GL002280 [Levilactobacillus parabrevis]